MRLDQLDQQIVDVLAADHPQSVRHVFYRMTDPRLPEPVEKSDKGYRHVQARCKALRLSGRVPYGWIADASRRGHFVDTYADAGDFLVRNARGYRANPWVAADTHAEVWVESRSIASILQTDCEELAIDLYPCGGFSSISFVHDACRYACDHVTKENISIVYVGDYDPAGVLIGASLEREMRKHLGGRFNFEFRRVAINEAQIVEYDLPKNLRKLTDKRSLHVLHTVEAEAMPARVLRGLVRDAVEQHLPDGAMELAVASEYAERAALVRLASTYRAEALP